MICHKIIVIITNCYISYPVCTTNVTDINQT